jgi:hypothetical protein
VRSVEAQRRVSADPAGLALLLAGPAAAELWPDGECSAAVVPEPRPEAGPVIEVAPPRRAGLGFAAKVSVRTPYGSARGRLTVVPEAGPPSGSALRLELTVDDRAGERLQTCAVRYLDNLGRAAVSRSSAA